MAGPKGSSPRSPIRRRGEQHEGEHGLDDEAGGGAQRARRPSPASRGRGRAGAASLTSPIPRLRGRDQGEHEEDGEQHRGAETRAQQRRPVARRRSAATVSSTAPIPIDGHDDAVGQQLVLEVDHREQHAGAGEEEEGRQLPGEPEPERRRARTAAPSRASTTGGRTASRRPAGSDHGKRPAARFTRWPDTEAEDSGDERGQDGGHGGHPDTASLLRPGPGRIASAA